MEHSRFDEVEFAASNFERRAWCDGYGVEIGAKVSRECFCAHDRGVDFCVGCDAFEDVGDVARVVHFGVIANDGDDLARIADGFDSRHEFVFEALFDGIDEDIAGGAFDEEGVVGRTATRFVAVEVAQSPVYSTYAIDRR